MPEWMILYMGIGTVVGAVMMFFHVAKQPCDKGPGWHTIDALFICAVWPLAILVVIVGVVAGLIHHKKHH